MAERCYLVLALAPAGMAAEAANRLFNDYIADERRGVAVYHDHFIGDHGGLAVFDVRSEHERALLGDAGPLLGWQVRSWPLAFSQSAAGFAAQIDFTLRQYRGTTLAELAAAEAPQKRHWWRRDRHAGWLGRLGRLGR